MPRPRPLVIPFERRAPGLFDDVSLRIILSMYHCSPHIESTFARLVGISPAEIRRRLKLLRERAGLRVSARPNLAKLDLVNVIAILRAPPGSPPESLSSILMKFTFWRYIHVVYASRPLVLANFTTPYKYLDLVEDFLGRLRKYGLVDELRVYFFANSHFNSYSLKYYDWSRKRWKIALEEWACNVLESEVASLPVSLQERPRGRCMIQDDIDLKLLEELEVSAERPLYEIARRLPYSWQQVYYHYKAHIIGQGLITQYVPLVFTVRPSLAYTVTAIMKLAGPLGFAQLYAASTGRPFICMIAQELDGNYAAMTFHVPRTLLLNLYKALDYLRDHGFIRSYEVFLHGNWRLGRALPYGKLYDFDEEYWRPPRKDLLDLP